MSILTAAIKGRNLVEFMYENKHRVVEPHTYGVNKKGHRSLRAYQVAGTSSSPRLGWRMFDESAMHGLRMLPEQFAAPRQDYKRGDSGFRLIIAQL